MPQISEVQCIYWSSLDPSPIPFLPNAINTLAGPNGSCKTSLMDAIKVIFGINKLFEDRGPHAYIYENPVTGKGTAQHAIIKVAFSNPFNERGRRPFGLIAPGMDTADTVTAICRVLRNGRREYALIAGPMDWTDTGSIEPSLHRIRSERTGTGFLTPDEWNDRVLRRIGVTRALQSVLAMDQFETASLTRKKPDELLDAILQIAGEQTTRQKYDQARAALGISEQELIDADRRLREEQLRLGELEHKRNRHLAYEETKRQGQELRRRERIARWRDAQNSRKDIDHDMEVLEQKSTALSERQQELANSRNFLQERAALLSKSLEEKRVAYSDFDSVLRKSEIRKGELSAEMARLQDEIARLEQIPAADLGELLQKQAQLQADYAKAVVVCSKINSEVEELEKVIRALENGRVPAPPGFDELISVLKLRGLNPAVLGDHVHFRDPQALEAAAVALGAHAWAIAVDSEHWEQARRIAAERQISCELVIDSRVNPEAEDHAPSNSLLAGCSVDDQRFLPFLRERKLHVTVALPKWDLHDEAVSHLGASASVDGVLQTSSSAQFGRQRSLLTFNIEQQLKQSLMQRATVLVQRDKATDSERSLAGHLDHLRTFISEQRDRQELAGKRSVLDKVQAELLQLSMELRRVEEGRDLAKAEGEQVQIRIQQVETDQQAVEKDDKSAAEQMRGLESRRVELAERARSLNETQLSLALSAEEMQQASFEEERVEVLSAKAGAAEDSLANFEEDVRGPAILADHAAQEIRVQTIRNLVEGKQSDARRARDLCDVARTDYYEYLKRFGERLGKSFRETCADCGADGELSIRGFQESRPYLHVAVAHNRGERLIPYRDTPHSGGQRAKISMLLLIAAMGLDGSTDFMVLDEPTAHMSGNVIRQVNELLDNLVHNRGRSVQFIFAVPTKAEKELASLLSDQQILFFLRSPGEPFSPPVVRVVRDNSALGASA